MAFNLSPAVNIIEEDYSDFVSGISSSVGAIVGEFEWGPIDQVTTVTSEEELIRLFGKPTNTHFVDWFCALNFLNYGRNLKVVRTIRNTTPDATNAGTGGAAPLIRNPQDINYTALTGEAFVAKYAGTQGNNIGVSICQNADFDSWLYKNYFDRAPLGDDVWVVVTYTENNVTEVVESWALSMAAGSVDGDGQPNWIQTALERSSEYIYGYATEIDSDRATAPTTTGTDGVVIESDKKTFTSASADFVTDSIAVGDQLIIASGINAGVYDVTAITDLNNIVLSSELQASTGMSFSFKSPLTQSGNDSYTALTGGTNSSAAAAGDFNLGWDLFSDAAQVDVSLLIAGSAAEVDTSMTVPRYIIENIAEIRKDCVAFISPQNASVVGLSTGQVANMIADRNLLPSSSYGFFDGNYKFQYDKYNDVFRWVPLNGDIAGLAAQTDATNDPWFSFAGYNRGLVKNVTKLAFSPNKANRDDMYLEGINAVITEVGAGTLLFGDKTLQQRASAFDRVNVRRLFIAVEKAIATAAKFNLFEFNDEFTRTRFVQSISPFLRDVQSRRGIIEFAVIADTTVNTPVVIDNNEFRANILIKPAKSINYINLTFTAVASGVTFDEIIVAQNQ